MKFTVKSMVLAAMLVAGSANAAAIVNVDQATGSDVYLAVYDFNNKFSSVFDLGSAFSFSSVVSGTAASQTFDLSADSSWTSLIAATSTSNLKWGVFAGQRPASNQAVSLETYAAGVAPVAGTSFKSTNNYSQNQAVTTFLNSAANVGGLTQGGSIFTSVISSAPFAGTTSLLGGTGKINTTGTVVVNKLDTFANILTYTSTVNTTAASTLNTFASTVGFQLSSAGVLTYTALPVPETDTYAMLLAGLGVMGFVARRRLTA